MKKVLLVLVLLTVGLLGYELGIEHGDAPPAPPEIADPFDPPRPIVDPFAQGQADVIDTSQTARAPRPDPRDQQLEAQAVADAVVAAQRRERTAAGD